MLPNNEITKEKKKRIYRIKYQNKEFRNILGFGCIIIIFCRLICVFELLPMVDKIDCYQGYGNENSVTKQA